MGRFHPLFPARYIVLLKTIANLALHNRYAGNALFTKSSSEPVINVKTIKTKILIADDDPFYREAGRDALEIAGYHVTLAADGAEAIAALKRDVFHAATVDLTMPLADGVAVIESARAGGPNANTPIVVITGHDDTSAIERAYNAGATSFLTKPLNWLLFTHHMNFVVRSGRIETELRETTTAAAFLSDLKSQMMGALAREFQTPVKTIFGFAELIRREVYGPFQPPAYRDMAIDMGNAAQRLNASFLKLMELGNALTEQLDLKTERFALKDTINSVLTTLADQAERRHVRLELRFDISDTLAIEADRVLFVQAVRSIVANAIKIAPRNTRVEVHAWLGEEGDFRLSAYDQGPAISASILAEIKRPAQQRPAATSETETRDVGIKIAKVLTEAHQGRLDVQTDGVSSNLVRIEFPRARLTETSAADAKAAAAAAVDPRIAEISAALAEDPRVRLASAARSATPGGPLLPQLKSPALMDIMGDGTP